MANFDFQQTAQDLQEFVNRTPAEIAELRALYEALTQTDVTPVAAADWPVSDPQENVIYRVAGTSSYTDYIWNGTDFIPMATYDNVPTDIPAVGSTDVITAGGMANHGSAFDISEYNKIGSTLATYADLAAALSAVPSSVQKGGMSVKFVQTSDNKYVQYRNMNQNWSTTTEDWQGVDDEPTPGSKNLVESGGVVGVITKTNLLIGYHPTSYYEYYVNNPTIGSLGVADSTHNSYLIKIDGIVSLYLDDFAFLYSPQSYDINYNVVCYNDYPGSTGYQYYIGNATYNSENGQFTTLSGTKYILISVNPYMMGETAMIYDANSNYRKKIRNIEDYYVPYYIYNKTKSLFNFYFDQTWKVDADSGTIFLLGVDGYITLTQTTISAPSLTDPSGVFYFIINITNGNIELIYDSLENLYKGYFSSGNYRILGYGNPSEKNNFTTSNSYRYNGKEIDYKKSYNMVEAFYYHENNLALTIEYGGANGIQVKNGAAFLKLVIDGNVAGWFNLTAGQKTATANNDPDISDYFGLYYYLVFDVVSKEFDVLTAAQLNQIVDSTYVIGHGRLGIDKFTSAFEININDITIGGNNVIYSSQKKILWIGTSIPAGSTYPVNSCKNNKRMCINKAIGASYIGLGRTETPETPPALDLSLSKTIAEYEAQYRPLVAQGLLTEETLNAWKNASYENVIMPYINDIDIIVFDHGYNDGSLINNEVTNPNWNSEDRTTFVGAFNYLMRKIFEVNPLIKIFISTYFQDKTEDRQASLQQIKNVVEMQKKISEHFGYPLLDSYKYCDFDGYFVPNTNSYMEDYNTAHGTNYTQYWSDADGNMKRYQMYCIDGVHPYTDEAKEYLDKVYTHLLAGLI